jgi:hypothetical protein
VEACREMSSIAESLVMVEPSCLTCSPVPLMAQVDPLGDLTTELERALGRLVKEKHGTDFYILHR